MELIDKRAALACFRDWTDRRGNIHEADEMPECKAIERLPAICILTPCDACAYNPPGSGDGKPCTMGTANVSRYNGHKSFRCEKCGLSFME